MESPFVWLLKARPTRPWFHSYLKVHVRACKETRRVSSMHGQRRRHRENERKRERGCKRSTRASQASPTTISARLLPSFSLFLVAKSPQPKRRRRRRWKTASYAVAVQAAEDAGNQPGTSGHVPALSDKPYRPGKSSLQSPGFLLLSRFLLDQKRLGSPRSCSSLSLSRVRLLPLDTSLWTLLPLPTFFFLGLTVYSVACSPRCVVPPGRYTNPDLLRYAR